MVAGEEWGKPGVDYSDWKFDANSRIDNYCVTNLAYDMLFEPIILDKHK